MTFGTFGKMTGFLDQHRVDVENFDKLSVKPLRALYEETQGREVSLVYDRKMCRVVRIAANVKILISASGGYELHEIRREYQNGRVIPGVKEWSISETLKRGEDVLSTAVRGLEEECGLCIHREQLVQENTIPETHMHESTVYEGLMSCSNIYRVKLRLTKRPWTDDRVLDDNGTRVCTRWLLVT